MGGAQVGQDGIAQFFIDAAQRRARRLGEGADTFGDGVAVRLSLTAPFDQSDVAVIGGCRLASRR